jgi:NAD(P)-dependent dehydrogenase (short-subunit alcohol dehydrogenase family)
MIYALRLLLMRVGPAENCHDRRATVANKRTILIVGASRGLGLALVEQFCSRDWHVIGTVRGNSAALGDLEARFPASIEKETADIADEASVRALRQRLNSRTLDMLFVNAGIAKSIEETPGTAPVQDFLDMMLINAFSPIRLIEIFEDIVAPNGTIAAMSSELGSITGNDGSWDLYASSKAALNMLMKCYTAHHPDDRRAKLVVAPGWIQTDMGGSEATYTVEECIPLVADILEKNHGKPGLRYVDRFDNTLPW